MAGTVKLLNHIFASYYPESLMDLNVRAFRTVQEALNEPSSENKAKKDASRKGGLIGGPSRARSISAKRRSEIAKKASAARWRKRGC
jgi:hypothetical protein